jgi:hypothetical protein
MHAQRVVGQLSEMHHRIVSFHIFGRQATNVALSLPARGGGEVVVQQTIRVKIGVDAAYAMAALLEVRNEAGPDVTFVTGDKNLHSDERESETRKRKGNVETMSAETV